MKSDKVAKPKLSYGESFHVKVACRVQIRKKTLCQSSDKFG